MLVLDESRLLKETKSNVNSIFKIVDSSGSARQPQIRSQIYGIQFVNVYNFKFVTLPTTSCFCTFHSNSPNQPIQTQSNSFVQANSISALSQISFHANSLDNTDSH